MKKKIKNVLIIAASSDMAGFLIKKLTDDKVNVYAASRTPLEFCSPFLKKYYLDVSKKENIDNFFLRLDKKITFDAVICFQGVAIASPVENLSEDELLKQFKISFFSVLSILKNLKGLIGSEGIIINISSMASFGLFPFISPYSMAKASADILLSCYEIETGIKTVSIKPGVVSTKFWNFCIKENEKNFYSFKGKYEIQGSFLKDNAYKNSNKGIRPDKVSKLIYKILCSNNPKSSYLIGKDAYIAKFASLFKGRFLFNLIRFILKSKIRSYLNEK